jgi:hypothetical protein
MRPVARRPGIARLAAKFASISTQYLQRPLLWRYGQPRTLNAIQRSVEWLESVRAEMSASGRLLGFDIGDWSVVAAGLALVGLLTMLL